MDIILCEGKHDAWFFEECLRIKKGIDKIYSIPDGRMEVFQEKFLNARCYNFVAKYYTLVVYGDNGRPTIYTKTLQRMIVDALGKIEDELNIYLIIDEDGTSYQKLKETVIAKIDTFAKDKMKFSPLPILDVNDEKITLKSPRYASSISVNILTVPSSLELNVAKMYIETMGKSCNIKAEDGPHFAIDMISYESFGGNKEKLFRYASSLFDEEKWLLDIINIVGKDY